MGCENDPLPSFPGGEPEGFMATHQSGVEMAVVIAFETAILSGKKTDLVTDS